MKKRKKPLGYNKRSEEQRIYDIRFCADLFLRGYSYREIADALNRDLSARGMGYTMPYRMEAGTVGYNRRICYAGIAQVG